MKLDISLIKSDIHYTFPVKTRNQIIARGYLLISIHSKYTKKKKIRLQRDLTNCLLTFLATAETNPQLQEIRNVLLRHLYKPSIKASDIFT